MDTSDCFSSVGGRSQQSSVGGSSRSGQSSVGGSSGSGRSRRSRISSYKRLSNSTKQNYLPDGRRIPQVEQNGFHYDVHLRKVLNAKPHIDNKEPQHHTTTRAKLSLLNSWKDRAERVEIAKGNDRLMKKLNNVYRGDAGVSQYYKKSANAPLNAAKFRLADLTEQNMSLRRRIMERGPDPTVEQKSMDRWWETTKKRMQSMSKYPLHFNLDRDLRTTLRSRCYMDISLDSGAHVGRLVFELFGDICPKTCMHFIGICNGTNESGLCYEGSALHRITPGVCFHGGIVPAVSDNNKKLSFLDAENYILNHDRVGTLSMDGRAESQFMVSFAPLPALDGKKVVFGRVAAGVKTLRRIEEFGTTAGRPKQRLHVRQSGQLYGRPCNTCVSAQQEECQEEEEDDDSASCM